MGFEKGNHWGGARPGAGRKCKLITLAKNAIVENKIATANAAFAFLEKIMLDERQPLAARQAAACWIHETVFGKANQGVTIDAVVDDVGRLSADERHERIAEYERRRGIRVSAVATGG